MTAEERNYPKLRIFDSPLVFEVLVGASVEEGILFPTMAMQVTKHEHSSLVVQLPDQLLAVEYRGVQEYVRLDPFPVQIHT